MQQKFTISEKNVDSGNDRIIVCVDIGEEITMLRLLTRGSRMRELYLKYLAVRRHGESSPNLLKEVVEDMRNALSSGNGNRPARPDWMTRKKFLEFRKALKGLDPGSSCA